ncbi:hypothetical protein [Halalkalicoccus sp. NIPERK01]|uniref:DUF7544 domain-containing protein n=1 Tax=Halalkalicoccus sp. NIPERK01 TaxID=3053469 RepID=UPI00256F4FAC|nr:hypothetical protein [Halalkalicoccus sp. NIPERK01]MDL5363276.1 hypothetical protein [Halalkalicoccus sp. NIPERK01]
MDREFLTSLSVERLLVLAVIVFFIGLILAALLVQVPMQTDLRYYALLVLGDTNEALDPIPDVRVNVRDTDITARHTRP